MLKRRARGLGMVGRRGRRDRAGSGGPAAPVTAPWLGMELPVAMAERLPLRSKCSQTNLKPMEEGVRYEYS